MRFWLCKLLVIKKLKFTNNSSKILNVRQNISISSKIPLAMISKNNLTVITTIIHLESSKNTMILKVNVKNNLKGKILKNSNIKWRNGWLGTFITTPSTEFVSNSPGLLQRFPFKTRKTKINLNISSFWLLICLIKLLRLRKKKKMRKSQSTLQKLDTTSFSEARKKKPLKSLWINLKAYQKKIMKTFIDKDF